MLSGDAAQVLSLRSKSGDNGSRGSFLERDSRTFPLIPRFVETLREWLHIGLPKFTFSTE